MKAGSNFSLSLYWKCQLVGWSLASLYWGYIAFSTGRFNFSQGIADFICDVFVGILLTHLYKKLALKNNWQLLKLKALVPRIAPAILLLALAYMLLIVCKLYLIRKTIGADSNLAFSIFFTLNWLTLFITGTRLMSIWVLAYHLYHYAQREINTARENARLSIIAKDAQLTNLSAQLNPHFFFNALNNIKFLVTENPTSARRAIDLLSDLLRNSLYCKNETLIPVKEEISLVRDYLELEKMRFEERLQVRIIVHEKLLDILIPPLSIQALVENAIKHGIDKRKNGGFIKVKVEEKDGHIKINVQNSGKFTNDSETGLGLENLKERLQLQFNGRAGFDIRQIENETVSATMLIPEA